MKLKTTKREIMQNYSKVIAIGYCDLQFLLNGRFPIACTCGVYGWNADIYDVPLYSGVCICTGYRPFGNVRLPWDMVDRYNRAARDCKSAAEREGLLRGFVKEAISEKEN